MAMASDPSSGTVIRIFGIVSPTIGPQPAPEPTKTPIPIWESLPRPLIYDHFSGEALDSTLWREASWAYPEDAGPTSNLSYQQIDDRLVLEARPVSYLTGLELDARLPNQRTLDQVNAFEARMYLPGGGARPWATAVVKLKARFGDVSWQAECRLGGLYREPSFSCSVVNLSRGEDEYVSEARPILYDQWYVVRIELNPSSRALQFYLDGDLVDHYVPLDVAQLNQAIFTPTIGIQAINGYFVAWVDDVRITE